jgi:hypothetical protein
MDGGVDEAVVMILQVRRIDDYRACHDFTSLATKLIENKAHLALPSPKQPRCS